MVCSSAADQAGSGDEGEDVEVVGPRYRVVSRATTAKKRQASNGTEIEGRGSVVVRNENSLDHVRKIMRLKTEMAK